MKKTGRSVAEREWRMNPYTLGFGLDVRLFSVCAHLRRDLNPSCKGFSMAALLALAMSLYGLLGRKHMVCAHTAYNLRGVSESDRANLRGNGDDKLLNDKSLPSGAVGFSGIIEMLAGE